MPVVVAYKYLFTSHHFYLFRNLKDLLRGHFAGDLFIYMKNTFSRTYRFVQMGLIITVPTIFIRISLKFFIWGMDM